MAGAKEWCCNVVFRRSNKTPEDETDGKTSREILDDEQETSSEQLLIDDNFNLPISLALTILLIYILIGCFIYTM